MGYPRAPEKLTIKISLKFLPPIENSRALVQDCWVLTSSLCLSSCILMEIASIIGRSGGGRAGEATNEC